VCTRLGGTREALQEQWVILFYVEKNENHQLGTGIFVTQGTVPAVKKIRIY
jgi:hypothetical protein